MNASARTLLFALGFALSAASGMTSALAGEALPAATKMAIKPGPALAATAVFAADGTLWAVRSEAGHVLLQSSKDTGGRWSPAVKINPEPEAIAADGDGAPKLALGPQGELYVTWTKPLARPFSGAVRFARSLDGGKTFSAPLTVHADRQEITHRFDALAVTSSGQIVVAWIDKRDLEQAKKSATEYRGAAVYFAVSDDRGATFRGDTRLADHSCECCRLALRADGEHEVIALWRHVFAPNIRDHALARFSTDGTVQEFRRATFDGWAVDGCPHHGPAIARDARGRLHAVWFTGAEGKAGVHYGRLIDGTEGGKVEGQRKLGAGNTAAHADLAVSGERVAIAWKEFDGRQTQLFGEISDDGGEHWRRSAVAQTDGPSDHPRLLVKGRDFYVLWNTEKEPMRVVALQ